MRASNDLFRFLTCAKSLAYGGFVALALAGAPVAFAGSNLQGFRTVNIATSGKVATITPGTTSAASGSFLGSVSPPANMSGWVPAGNFGAAASATGPTMTTYKGGGDVFFAGTKYPFQAGYEVPASTLVDAVKAVTGGPLGIALFAAPLIGNWLTSSGGRVSPTTGLLERTDPTVCSVAPCNNYQVTGYGPVRSSPQAACSDAAMASYGGAGVLTNADTFCYMYRANGSYGNGIGVDAWTVNPSPANWLPSSMDDIAPYMAQNRPPAGVTQEILDRGGEVALPNPTITGPASLDGPESSTVNPDGTRTVTKTTMNFSPSGNTITNTSNVTNTTTYNTDNSIKSTSVTTVTPATQKDQQSECEKNPDSAGCSKLDVDKVEVPKIDKVVTYAQEDLGLGAGSCPAPVAFHTSLTDGAISFTPYCNFLTTWVRPILILFAFLAAFFIIAPIKQE